MASTRLLLPLVPLALMQSACSRTHPAETATELQDELRIIAAAGRAVIENQSESDDICIARRIAPSAVRRSAELPAAVSQQTVNSEPSRPQLSDERILADDRAILEAMGEVVLGPSCAGTNFLSFSRVQFGSDAALASASLRDPCGGRFLEFRLRRAHGDWQVIESRALSAYSDFSCPDSIPVRTEEGYFRLIGQRRITWLPVAAEPAPGGH